VRDVLSRKTLAATAILTGKMKVEGDKMTLLKHTSAHRALVACAAALDTEFPSGRTLVHRGPFMLSQRARPHALDLGDDRGGRATIAGSARSDPRTRARRS
jgi:hypothetical protein